MSAKKIGIMGGTFDPIHLAHLIIAQEVLEELKLQQVWFVPCFTPPHKRPNFVTPPQHRLQMLKLALAGDDRFEVCDLEIRRQEISYTVDTLRELSLEKPKKQLYLILGSDNLRLLPSWKRPQQIFELARVVLVKRPGFGYSIGKRWVKKAVTVEVPQLEISSSQIRHRVRDGQNISLWVPEKVRKYIEKHHLYQR